jgi:hypothetical protein
MANWQKSTQRQSPKTKEELRQMLADAVRNTKPDQNQDPEHEDQPGNS